MPKTIALIGDFNLKVTAHQAIPLAIDIANRVHNFSFDSYWIETNTLKQFDLAQFDGFWCVPASPYQDMQATLDAIRFARERNLPFLGTCGGYQHAVLEFAQNELGLSEADNGEVNPDAAMPLISTLSCALVEQDDAILIQTGSKVESIYASNATSETYRCSFGVNPKYLSIFDHSNLQFSGKDRAGEPRIFELNNHPFFIGTAFQPERSALHNKTHPLITAFLRAVENS